MLVNNKRNIFLPFSGLIHVKTQNVSVYGNRGYLVTEDVNVSRQECLAKQITQILNAEADCEQYTVFIILFVLLLDSPMASSSVRYSNEVPGEVTATSRD